MAIRVLRCPNCGADLDVVEGVETIRCKFCGARCQLEGSGRNQHLTLITQQLGRIEEHAARTSAEIEAMRQQQSHGLVSQFQTDEALRRAAAAQEAAAHEAAYAARAQSATHEAIAHAGQQWAAEHDAERKKVVVFRSWRNRFNAVAVLGALGILGLLGRWLATANWEGRLGPAGAVTVAILLGAWGWAAFFSYCAAGAGRKFNERAFLFGLREVRVRSKEQKGFGSANYAAWGCLYVMIAAGLVIWAASSTAELPTPKENSTPVGPTLPDNGASSPEEQSNSAPSNEAQENPPENSPRKNAPANGE